MAYQPKSYRKFLATSVAAAMVATAVAPMASAADAKFSDVSNQWFAEHVNYLVGKNVLDGFSDGTFRPNADVTRAQAAKMIVESLGLELPTTVSLSFPDTKNDVWYSAYVAVLVEKGILQGKPNGNFDPNGKITRAELAKIVVEAYELKKDESSIINLTDVVAGSWYEGYVNTLYSLGVVGGKSAGKFVPGDNVTRAEAAAFLHRTEVESKRLEVEKSSPVVLSVKHLNATQVEVKFNQAVTKASLFANGTGGAFVNGVVVLNSIDNVPAGNLTGALSADGKTLTITAANALSKRYDVVIEGVKTAKDETVTKYQQVLNFAADTTAPTIVSTTKNSAGSFTVKFSEPLRSLGNVTARLADGTSVQIGGNGVTHNFVQGASEVTFTVGTDVAINREVIVTFIGAQDQALNLMTPNPATVSFIKGAPDGVKPTVTAVAQTGARSFTVKFSEELISAPAVSLGTGITIESVTKDATDATLYHVRSQSVLEGAYNLTVSNFIDLSGEVGNAYSRVITFSKDTVAPKLASSAVVSDATNHKQYLELTFDKDIALGASPTVAGSGTFVKDFITTSVSLPATAVSHKGNNKKVLRVELDTFLGGTTTDVENAVYSLNLTFAGVTSDANVAVGTTAVSFTRGKDGVAANTDLVTVVSAAQAANNNNQVLVTFDRAVDGASATNAANYRIDGAVVESVTLNPAANGTQVAVLNLQAGSNQFTGVRNINISGVKALGSTRVMNAWARTIDLRENVAPTVTSARLTATNQITLTFSEAITSGTGLDFEVLVGGEARATVNNVSVTTNGYVTTVVVDINAITAAELGKGLSLKALSTLDIFDAAGNKLSVPANINVTN